MPFQPLNSPHGNMPWEGRASGLMPVQSWEALSKGGPAHGWWAKSGPQQSAAEGWLGEGTLATAAPHPCRNLGGICLRSGGGA